MLKVSINLHGGEHGCFSYTNNMSVEEFKFFMESLRNGLTVEHYEEHYRYNTNEPYTVEVFSNEENEDQLYYNISLYKVVPVLVRDE